MTSDWDEWIKGFLTVWINGLLQGIKEIKDSEVKQQVFRHAGAACAKAHAEILFKKSWEEAHGNFDEFLEILNRKFGEEIYTRISKGEIMASYPKCYCPLVELGLTNSPILCNCSPNWIKHNFEKILKKSVKVRKLKSILSGGGKCKFSITFKEKNN
jgi:predicted ArsR family transcriptional regulator